MNTAEKQAAFEHARQYGDRWYESHRVTARDAFLAGVKWARENAAECQRCAEQYEYEVRNR